MNITLIAGARPNFMKVAPIIHAMDEANAQNGELFRYRLVHTGQHYDKIMSDTFFEELNIPHPDANLGCGGGSQAEQTAAIMVAFEKELQVHPADLVMVVGDVTSTMACSIVAKKLNTKVAHVEAGIRSFDLSMPEEINRMVTDSITDVFFTTSTWAGENLKKNGITEEATVMGVPCMTLRDNTERPETIELGTNELIGTDPANIPPAFERLLRGEWKTGDIPEKWDGNAARRIVSCLKTIADREGHKEQDAYYSKP